MAFFFLKNASFSASRMHKSLPNLMYISHFSKLFFFEKKISKKTGETITYFIRNEMGTMERRGKRKKKKRKGKKTERKGREGMKQAQHQKPILIESTTA